MSDKNALTERGRALEDEYFRKKDRELIEKLRRAAAAAQAQRDMGAKAGLDEPEMLRELQALGFTADTVSLLPFVPLVQIAWAEGGVTGAERELIVQLARTRGIAEASDADRQLATWLTSRPDADVFTRATRLIRAVLDAPPPVEPHVTADDLIGYCERIAAASGGILGIHRVSAQERALLAEIAAKLKGRSS